MKILRQTTTDSVDTLFSVSNEDKQDDMGYMFQIEAVGPNEGSAKNYVKDMIKKLRKDLDTLEANFSDKQ